MAWASKIGDRSYGIIPLRYTPGISSANVRPTSENTQVLLIYQKTARRSIPWFWCFPKGHAEVDDPSLQHTAIRELEEETGLKIELSDLLEFEGSEDHSSFKEVYVNPIRNVGKEVRYWVGLVRDGQSNIRVQKREVADARWCDWDGALKLITFEETRNMLKAVESSLSGSKRLKTNL
jgi:bis(5'-nucleosidyl)-tetraphosphatase